MTITVSASEVRKGDICILTLETVEGIQRKGMNVPSGKVRVALSNNTRKRVATWSAKTEILVERLEVSA